ncbi:hypothetical protein Hanom_Chr04g00339701 [Helianthus anomalus]
MSSDTNCWSQLDLKLSFHAIWQVISTNMKIVCGNRNQTFKKQDLQNFQVYITLKQNGLQGDGEVIIY